MSDKEVLEAFGTVLITAVRDRALDRFNTIESGTLKSEQAIELHQSLKVFTAEQLQVIKTIVNATVDTTLFNVLSMLEQHEDEMQLLMEGKNICEISDGLAGELVSSDGWIEKFSKHKV
ncbi:hypothetical protein [Flavobacterium sp. '19STA2R22 D10 B1']|uniref:hypothetical protein n=1 Tax=Flavobacterium aerium TaxID=3037261 RepID=UPI00278C2C93|nr:hypothetical protein [Flavobacterium sp. '19STA2R22 D10 B1']